VKRFSSQIIVEFPSVVISLQQVIVAIILHPDYPPFSYRLENLFQKYLVEAELNLVLIKGMIK